MCAKQKNKRMGQYGRKGKHMKKLKYENIDACAALESVMKQNTAFFQSDLDYDKELVMEQARNSGRDRMTLLWLSRPTGTECLRERDVFIKGTADNNIWCYYAEQASDYILTYAVELSGVQDGKAMGNLYELDYGRHYSRVKSGAVNAGKILVVYEHGIREFDHAANFTREPDAVLGKFKRFEEQPDDPETLQGLLRDEKRMREKMEAGDFVKHLVALREDMIQREAWRIARQFKQLPEPNTENGESFAVEISHTFVPLSSVDDLERIRSILPYQTLRFIHDTQTSRRVYAAIGKDEERNVKIPSAYWGI